MCVRLSFQFVEKLHFKLLFCIIIVFCRGGPMCPPAGDDRLFSQNRHSSIIIVSGGHTGPPLQLFSENVFALFLQAETGVIFHARFSF